MAYLEQSTRYVPYTDKLHGRWRYHVPAEVEGVTARPLHRMMDAAFETVRRVDRGDAGALRARAIRGAAATATACTGPRFAPRRSTRCAACCRRRRSRTSGIYGTGQAYEALLLRMRAHPLTKSATCARRDARELRKVIPAFLDAGRPARPRRRWSEYLGETRDGARPWPTALLGDHDAEPRAEVTLTDFDPEGETRSSRRRCTRSPRCPTINSSRSRDG